MADSLLRWSGGTDFLRNITNALLSLQKEHSLELFLLVPVTNKIDSLEDLAFVLRRTVTMAITMRRLYAPFPESPLKAKLTDFLANIDGELPLVEYNPKTGLLRALRRIGADVVMPTTRSLGSNFPVPWVGYIYDFQHRYYPELFGPRACFSRDIRFATVLRDAQTIMVHGATVAADISAFFPYHSCKIFNLPFSPAPLSAWLGRERRLEKYRLPTRYLLICNQFWVHKAHATAFRALAELGNRAVGQDLHLVCTGATEDYRCPHHFESLREEVKALGIQDRIHFLGHIPKADQIAIMRNSLCVLQPTLFEGAPGGGSVFEAVSLGVPVILSDIPVNREIGEVENVRYFKSKSPGDLADHIEKLTRGSLPRPEDTELLSRGDKRKQALGRSLLEVIDSAISERNCDL